MGRFYGIRIQAGEMALVDAPKLWKAVTEKWIREQEV